MKRYYIAYGSNLNVSQMAFRCPDAKLIGKTVMKDWRLLFKGSKTGSYLTIEREAGSTVPVGVWEVSERDELMLDRYEGYPTFYYKKHLVLMRNGEPCDAFVYIMHENRPIGIPSMSYVNTCREGYRNFGMDEAILEEALEYSIEKVKGETA